MIIHACIRFGNNLAEWKSLSSTTCQSKAIKHHSISTSNRDTKRRTNNQHDCILWRQHMTVFWILITQWSLECPMCVDLRKTRRKTLLSTEEINCGNSLMWDATRGLGFPVVVYHCTLKLGVDCRKVIRQDWNDLDAKYVESKLRKLVGGIIQWWDKKTRAIVYHTEKVNWDGMIK